MKTMKFEVTISKVDDVVDGDDMADQMHVALVAFAPMASVEVMFLDEDEEIEEPEDKHDD